ncbi:MAG: DUF4202 domain-containing protein [Rhodocyclales bacterium]|nr:DUF4202 domain-containing protein [Rhodocyclales bacterium]
MNDSTRFNRAIALIDAANSEDPRREEDEPKELLYSKRMSEMLARFAPEAPEVVKLGVRAQHIRRWAVPRDSYPMTREGYYAWRTGLYKFHAETAGALLREAGYDEETVARVMLAVSKRSLRSNPDAQLLEDVAALVFIEHYMLDFAASKPDYDEAKWIGIVQKTWRKMSGAAQQFALGGGIRLPEALIPIIQRAIAA